MFCKPNSIPTTEEDILLPNPEALGTLGRYDKLFREGVPSIEYLEDLLSSINGRTLNYNPLRFDGLRRYINHMLAPAERDEFYKVIIHVLIGAALSYPRESMKLKILKKSTRNTIRIDRDLICCILANSFFCTYNDAKRESNNNFKRINMGIIHGDENLAFKYPFFFNYFKRKFAETHTGSVEFSRFYEPPKDNFFWKSSSKYLCDVTTIESAPPEYIKVDFANKYIGGGVLGKGCVQEEILFLEHPELIVSRLFMEVQGPGDCIVLKGPEQFSKHINYASNTRFDGNVKDGTPHVGSELDFQKAILAIDAANYSKNKFSQFRECEILRELNKAYSGFSNTVEKGKGKIATGNWGCGAFKGNAHLKALIQVLAASQAECNELMYCTGNAEFNLKLIKTISRLREEGCTVGKLYSYIFECLKRIPRVNDSDDILFLDMVNVIVDNEKLKREEGKKQRSFFWGLF